MGLGNLGEMIANSLQWLKDSSGVVTPSCTCNRAWHDLLARVKVTSRDPSGGDISDPSAVKVLGTVGGRRLLMSI